MCEIVLHLRQLAAIIALFVSYFLGILQTKLYSATPYSLAALIESTSIQATHTNLRNDITHMHVIIAYTRTHLPTPACFVSDWYTQNLLAAKSLLVLLSSKQTNTTHREGTALADLPPPNSPRVAFGKHASIICAFVPVSISCFSYFVVQNKAFTFFHSFSHLS